MVRFYEEYDEHATCDVCHKKGAYYITGDIICDDCLAIYEQQQEE